jgi:hypothetical protein
MLFDIAKAKMSAANQAALGSLLGAWANANDVAKQAAINLQNEHGSTDGPLEGYLVDLACNQSRLSVPSPRQDFEVIGKPFALAGHESTPFKGAIFGRAMLLEKYARYLIPKLDALGYSDTEEEVRDTLRKMDNEDDKSAPPYMMGYYQAIRETPLGKGAVFATFAQPVAATQRPWPLPIPRADFVRGAIALGEDPTNKDYILFAYRLPDTVVPLVPTTASPGWFYQRWFRPNINAATDLHGWTEPLNPRFTRQPEIVHEEILGTKLLFPIHISTA